MTELFVRVLLNCNIQLQLREGIRCVIPPTRKPSEEWEPNFSVEDLPEALTQLLGFYQRSAVEVYLGRVRLSGEALQVLAHQADVFRKAKRGS
jgi:hypothetical protein